MPAKSPEVTRELQDRLTELGRQLRVRRKALGLTAVLVADAANLSRVTLHRIEKGEPSVTMGAYMIVADVLGWTLAFEDSQNQNRQESSAESLPLQINLAEYPVLAQLAWQVTAGTSITAREAFDVYIRNWRHIDEANLSAEERQLIESLRRAYGNIHNNV